MSSKGKEEEEEEVYMPETVVDYGATDLYGELHGEEAARKADRLFNTPTSGRWSVQEEQSRPYIEVGAAVGKSGGSPAVAPSPAQFNEVLLRMGLVMCGVVIAYGVYRMTSSLIKRL